MPHKFLYRAVAEQGASFIVETPFVLRTSLNLHVVVTPDMIGWNCNCFDSKQTTPRAQSRKGRQKLWRIRSTHCHLIRTGLSLLKVAHDLHIKKGAEDHKFYGAAHVGKHCILQLSSFSPCFDYFRILLRISGIMIQTLNLT